MARGLLLLKYVKSERYIDNLGFVIKKSPEIPGIFLYRIKRYYFIFSLVRVMYFSISRNSMEEVNSFSILSYMVKADL